MLKIYYSCDIDSDCALYYIEYKSFLKVEVWVKIKESIPFIARYLPEGKPLNLNIQSCI